eukprot:scaffold12962_cov135-Isochrysis_galbana.AAC.4
MEEYGRMGCVGGPKPRAVSVRVCDVGCGCGCVSVWGCCPHGSRQGGGSEVRIKALTPVMHVERAMGLVVASLVGCDGAYQRRDWRRRHGRRLTFQVEIGR